MLANVIVRNVLNMDLQIPGGMSWLLALTVLLNILCFFAANSDVHIISPPLTGYSQTPNMFLPRLSVPPKPNAKQLSSEQLESSAGDDEGQFDYSKDEESIEENQSGIDVNLEDWSQGDEDLKLKDEESDHLIAANCPGIDSAESNL